jgi:DNA-binding NtrC family response regulator
MMKRFVILRDEGLLLAELARERTIDSPAPSATPMFQPPGAVVAPLAAVAARPAPLAAGNGAATAPAPPVVATPKPGKLPDLARAAALSAEREAIQGALDHFRWNRRKAAAQLGVSYKTLLNKMKECGITAPGRDADEVEE